VSGSAHWVDPVIGSSGKGHVWKPVSLYAKGNIGGFDAASDFTWQVQGGVRRLSSRTSGRWSRQAQHSS